MSLEMGGGVFWGGRGWFPSSCRFDESPPPLLHHINRTMPCLGLRHTATDLGRFAAAPGASQYGVPDPMSVVPARVRLATPQLDPST